jgi:glyoxylate/hydroxypyruvate reductase A
MRIAFCTSFDPALHAAWLAELRALRPADEWCEAWQPGDCMDAAVVAQPPAGALARVQGLRLIHSLWAGVEGLLADPTLPAHVPLARMVDPAMTAAMAESAAWAVLSLHRRFFDYAAQQAQASWVQWPQRRADEVSVLVLGAGAMGLGVAGRLQGLGYRVRAWHRGAAPAPQEAVASARVFADARPRSDLPDAPAVPLVAGEAALAPALSTTEILVNLLPLTPHTRGMLCARTFDAMPPGGAVVNFGRGDHLIEADLLAALDRGHLHRAVLDVHAIEPLPPGHVFWRHPRITVLPHVAARTDQRSAAQVVAANLARLEEGEVPWHQVDRRRGY